MSRMSVAQRSRADHPADEVAAVAGEVENGRVGVDVALGSGRRSRARRPSLRADLALVEAGRRRRVERSRAGSQPAGLDLVRGSTG